MFFSPMGGGGGQQCALIGKIDVCNSGAPLHCVAVLAFQIGDVSIVTKCVAVPFVPNRGVCRKTNPLLFLTTEFYSVTHSLST